MVWLLLSHVHRHLETAVELVAVQPRSFVHVLRTQDELEEAVRRAATFERRATDESRSRVDPLRRHDGPERDFSDSR